MGNELLSHLVHVPAKHAAPYAMDSSSGGSALHSLPIFSHCLVHDPEMVDNGDRSVPRIPMAAKKRTKKVVFSDSESEQDVSDPEWRH